jgi:hypothetical protein
MIPRISANPLDKIVATKNGVSEKSIAHTATSFGRSVFKPRIAKRKPKTSVVNAMSPLAPDSGNRRTWEPDGINSNEYSGTIGANRLPMIATIAADIVMLGISLAGLSIFIEPAGIEGVSY